MFGYSMVVVGTHLTFLLIVVQWLKANHLTAKIFRFLLPFQGQPRLLGRTGDGGLRVTPGLLAGRPRPGDGAPAGRLGPALRVPHRGAAQGTPFVALSLWQGPFSSNWRFGASQQESGSHLARTRGFCFFTVSARSTFWPGHR